MKFAKPVDIKQCL